MLVAKGFITQTQCIIVMHEACITSRVREVKGALGKSLMTIYKPEALYSQSSLLIVPVLLIHRHNRYALHMASDL